MGNAPWIRKRKETAKSYAAFTLYRDLGPNRSLVKVGRAMGAKKSYTKWLEEWSRKFEWVARAELWDDHKDELRRKAGINGARAAARRFAEAADLLAKEALEQIEEGTHEPKDLAHLARVLEGASRVGSLARGQPTSRTVNESKVRLRTDTRPYEDLTDAELLEEIEREKEESGD